jgi:serine/threonine protein kinase
MNDEALEDEEADDATPDLSEMAESALKDLFNVSFDEVDTEEIHPLYNSLLNIGVRYRLSKELGRGAMKVVHEAEDLCVDRPVALAMLRPQFDRIYFDPFLREARLNARLEHPNIIKIHDIGSFNGRPFFTMELKPGVTLGTTISQLRHQQDQPTEIPSLEKRLEIFIKVCDAIAYAHSRDVIHLDLKPENIQVGSFGEVMVCDWGLGKVIHEDDHHSSTILSFDSEEFNPITLVGEIKGTPGYMAPEQVEPDQPKGTYTDIYALGAILYSILTHEIAFDGSSTADILRQTNLGQLRPFEETNQQELPDSLKAVVLKAMALNSKDRYPDVLLLREEVAQYLAGHATRAENAGFLRLATLLYRRHRAIVITALSACLFIVFSTAAFMVKLKQSESKAILEREMGDEQRIHAEEQRRIAEQQRQVAIEQQKQLTKAIDLYKMQRGITRNMGKEDSIRYLKSGVSHIQRSLIQQKPSLKVFNELIRQVDLKLSTGLSKEPHEHQSLIALKGVLSFITQDFDGAREMIHVGWLAPPDMAIACSQYHYSDYNMNLWERAASHDGGMLLQGKTLRQLIKDLPRDSEPWLPFKYRIVAQEEETSWLIATGELMAIYDGLSRLDKSSHAWVVFGILENLNPEWSGAVFQYDLATHSLTMGGHGLQKLSYSVLQQYCVLRTLKLDHLHFKNVRFILPNVLSELQLKSLDFEEVMIEHGEGLSELSSSSNVKVR